MTARLIEKALISAWDTFNAANGAMATAYENANYRPTQGTPWAQLFFLPDQPKVATLSGVGEDMHEGVFQVNLNYPQGAGSGAAADKADAIREYFEAGAKFVSGSQEVLVTSTGRAGGRNAEGWFILPVTINFMARTARSVT
jgi:hypothetical protein